MPLPSTLFAVLALCWFWGCSSTEVSNQPSLQTDLGNADAHRPSFHPVISSSLPGDQYSTSNTHQSDLPLRTHDWRTYPSPASTVPLGTSSRYSCGDFYDQSVHGPKNGHSHIATVILLHGRNGNYRHLYDLGEGSWHVDLGDRVKFIYLHSPRSGEWFRFKAINPLQMMSDISRGVEIADMASLEQSIAPLEALINQEAQALGSHSKVYLVGYSQGGMVALWHGLTTHNSLGGIVAINSAVPVVNMGHHTFPQCSQKPIMHFHGDSDNIVHPSFAQRGHNLAQQAGCSAYTLEISPGGHDLSSHVAGQINTWLVNQIR